MIPTFEEALTKAVAAAESATNRLPNSYKSGDAALTATAWAQIAALLKKDDS